MLFRSGKHSGSAAVCHVLAGQGIPIDRAQATRLLKRVRRQAARVKAPLPARRLASMSAELG